MINRKPAAAKLPVLAVAPVGLGFGEGGGDVEDEAFAIAPADAGGDEGGAFSYTTFDVNLVVGGDGKQVV
jgi:uncharacterized spore protein YtfJ